MIDRRAASNLIAALILGTMFVLVFFSSLNESAIMDELAHIPAGYSYLSQNDYRLNPEHPPLIKDLAALPLLFLDLNFPTDVKAWSKDVNGQWDMGRIFLYEAGNDPDRILFWARFPVMLLALFFGWLLFSWTRRVYGDKVGLLALTFFAFSPTFIAHSRYVTTDLAAAFGFFIGLVSFVRFLESRTLRRLLFAGLALGVALLLKFSLVLLIPLYVLLALLWLGLSNFEEFKIKFLGQILLIFIIAACVIWAVYQFHVWNYPAERQFSDTEFILSSFGFKPAVRLNLWMINKSVLRPLAEYLLGILMVAQRAAGGNTTYFLGETSASGWWYYFPVSYLLKEPLAFLILVLLALAAALKSVWQAKEKSLGIALEWMRDNFVLTSSVIFIAVYWIYSVRSPLNIGIRHVLPTFPFIYLLVSRELIRWVRTYSLPDPQNIGEWFKAIYNRYVKALPRYILITFLLVWMGLSVLSSFPYYLSYYNELAGGARSGYKFIVDSNYDWGQDLKNLSAFVQKNKIDLIALDYFGGGSPQYYLGDKFVPWQSLRGQPNPALKDPQWFAVSATIRQGAFGRPTKGFIQKPEESYLWLQGVEPVSRAGLSIFIYKF